MPKTTQVTLTWQGSGNSDSTSEVIPLPIPYELPPQPYTPEGPALFLIHSFRFWHHIYLNSGISSADVPWSWDRRYTKKDVYGQGWPRQVQLYSVQDS